MKAIVLLSGGIDSCVVLASALSSGRSCTALSFHYGQRHLRELQSAQHIAAYYGVEHRIIQIDPTLFSAAPSSLTDACLPVDCEENKHHPNTYVPCRNLLFLSYAASLAESTGASEIFFGAHANDGPSYPDCRKAFFNAFQTTVNLGSYIGKEGLTIVCPLLLLDKPAIVALGQKLKAPLDRTWSCYNPMKDAPCNVCPACTLRARAFRSCEEQATQNEDCNQQRNEPKPSKRAT